MALLGYQQELDIRGPFMDTSYPPSRCPAGIFPRLVGVDGRFLGGLRRFPGFTLVHDYETSDNLIGFHYAVSQGTRGFILYTTTSYTCTFGDTTVKQFSYGGAIDITYGDGSIFIFNAQLDDTSYRYRYTYGVAADSGTMGPLALTGELTAPEVDSQSDEGGYLNHRGMYRVAYRYYDSSRHLRTGLSDITDLVAADIIGDGDPEGDAHKVTITLDEDTDYETYQDAYDYVEIYRTPNLYNPLDPYQGGIFYLESTVSSDLLVADVGVVHDTALVLQDRYDPWADPVMNPPQSNTCHYYQGSIFAGQDASTNDGVGIVWTNPYKQSVEEFGSEYSYTGKSGDGAVKCFVETEDGLYALHGSGGYFINKTAGTTAFRRVLDGHGVISRKGALAVGNVLYVMTANGLIMFSGGQIQRVRAVQRIIDDEWIAGSGGFDNTLDEVEMAYDAAMGCVFILNPSRKMMLCLWESTQAVTILEGCPFKKATYGPDQTGDTDTIRAYFATNDGRVVTPDIDRDGGGSMTGHDYGYADSPYTVPNNDANGATLADEVGNGVCVYCTSGSNQGTWGYSDGSTINYIEPWGDADSSINLVADEIWVKSPVVFKARFWPVSAGYNPNFSRKVIKDIGLKLEKLYTDDGTTKPTFTIGALRNASADPDEFPATTKSMTATGDPPTDHVNLNVDGITVEPYIEQVGTNCDFELTGAIITGTITQSDKAAANS